MYYIWGPLELRTIPFALLHFIQYHILAWISFCISFLHAITALLSWQIPLYVSFNQQDALANKAVFTYLYDNGQPTCKNRTLIYIWQAFFYRIFFPSFLCFRQQTKSVFGKLKMHLHIKYIHLPIFFWQNTTYLQQEITYIYIFHTSHCNSPGNKIRVSAVKSFGRYKTPVRPSP